MTRDEFRQSVFERDNHKCVICGKDAQDAHHIIERRLWDDGGYHLDNGVSLCGYHHIAAEQTHLSCEDLRMAAGIENVIIPSHLYDEYEYDKWGNIMLPSGERLKGELFFDHSVQKILKQGKVLYLFSKYIKYPRTLHLPWSPGLTNDDRQLKSTEHFEGREVVVTVKMDGENCLDQETELNTDLGIKSIQDVCEQKIDCKVLSMDAETGQIEYKKIDGFSINENSKKEWYEIELEDGRMIKITGEHRVWLPNLNCYRCVKDLSENDEFLIND
jgi:hypothetical protein